MHYNGGKSGSGTYQQIINHIPLHNIYIELFAGMGGIFRKIRRAPLSILNDIDPTVIETWKKYKITDCDVSENYIQGNLFERSNRPQVIIRSSHYQTVLDKFKNNPQAFIYADPPYPMSTRRNSRQIYKFDWASDSDHLAFLDACSNAKCAVMISSYENELYNEKLKNWQKYSFKSMTRTGMRDEIIYMNYSKPLILHDLTYIGNNYRERDNIKKKVRRHTERLARLPDHERIAILSTIIQKYKSDTEILIQL